MAGSGSSNVVYEYFKKGHEPQDVDEAESKLEKPGNFKVSYENGKVTMSWSAVNPGNTGNESYGSFGYNIYKDGTLINWTNKTSYTFDTTSPYGTYKVIASYKSYSGIQSDAATYTLKEKTSTPDETTTPTESPSPTETPTESPTPSPSTNP